MVKFNRSQKDALTSYLYSLNIHDALVISTNYDFVNRILSLSLENTFYNDRFTFSFCDVHSFFVSRNDDDVDFGISNAVIGVSIEESSTYPSSQIQNQPQAEALYMVFQLFSLDELHILADEITVDTDCGLNEQELLR